MDQPKSRAADLTDPTPNRPVRLAVSSDRTAVIGHELRRIFNEAADEPVPEEFAILLRKLA